MIATTVRAGLVPAIHDLRPHREDVGGRDKPAPDGGYRGCDRYDWCAP